MKTIEICRVCHGEGKTNSQSHDTTGKETCGICNGTGRLVKYTHTFFVPFDKQGYAKDIDEDMFRLSLAGNKIR